MLSLLSLLSPLQNVEDLVSENALLKEQIEIMEETAVFEPLFFIREFEKLRQRLEDNVD